MSEHVQSRVNALNYFLSMMAQSLDEDPTDREGYFVCFIPRAQWV